MGRPRTTNKHLPKYVTVRHRSYWYGPPNVKAVRVAREGDLVNLYRYLADKLAPVKEATTLGDLMDRYTREILPTLSPRTQRDYVRHLTRLRAWCGHMKPEELTIEDVGHFLRPDPMPARGAIHRNRTIAVLASLYSIAIGLWYVKTPNPCRDAKRNRSRPRTRYVTDDEFSVAYAAMPETHQIAMDLALLTSQRQGDLLSLRWDQVSDEGILFMPAKTQKKVGKKILVQMSPALAAVLERAKRMPPQLPREYVIHPRKVQRNRDGTPKPFRYTSEGFRTPWQRTMRRLAKGYWRGHKGRPRVWIEPKLKERFTFHDLRAKSCSDSVNVEAAYERAGHTNMAMTRQVYMRGIQKVAPLK